MATATQNDITVTATWTDATVANGALANAEVLLQNLGAYPVYVVWGGGSAPSGKTGVRLGPDDSVRGTAANVWLMGSGKVSATLL